MRGVFKKDALGRDIHTDGTLVVERTPFRPECRRVGAYDSDEASFVSGLDMSHQVSRTQQSQADETDINGIVRRFRVTGILPQGVRRPTYGDFDGVSDFRTAMDAMLAAQKSFNSMPSEVRDRFQNDPQRFVEFCSDENNIEEMRKFGLAVPAPPKAAPVEVRVMNEPTAPAATVAK